METENITLLPSQTEKDSTENIVRRSRRQRRRERREREALKKIEMDKYITDVLTNATGSRYSNHDSRYASSFGYLGQRRPHFMEGQTV